MLFVDKFDPEWTFLMREREIKYRLMSDYCGRLQGAAKKEAASKAKDNEEIYALERFSHRIGALIDESPQALALKRGDWLEFAKPENRGAPNAMTTIVVNAKTSTIRAHALRGPLSLPDAEEGISHMFSGAKAFNILSNVTAQSIDYVRRKTEFF